MMMMIVTIQYMLWHIGDKNEDVGEYDQNGVGNDDYAIMVMIKKMNV